MNATTRLRTLLEKLLDQTVKCSNDLTSWYEAANEIEELAIASKVELPEIVWHYLSDADIRLKDQNYGEYQIEGVREFVKTLPDTESGY